MFLGHVPPAAKDNWTLSSGHSLPGWLTWGPCWKWIVGGWGQMAQTNWLTWARLHSSRRMCCLFFPAALHVTSPSSLLVQQRVVWDKELQETSSWTWFSCLVKISSYRTEGWNTMMQCDSWIAVGGTFMFCFSMRKGLSKPSSISAWLCCAGADLLLLSISSQSVLFS